MKRLLYLFILTLTISITSIAQPARQSATSGAITGRVINDSGQPIAGVFVTVGRISVRSSHRDTLTDAEGKFRVDDLPQGLYNVWLRAPSYVDTRDRSNPWHSKPGDNLTVTMTKGGVITGTVTDSDGEPVVGVAVTAFRARESEESKRNHLTRAASRETDDRGIYRLYGLPPGVYLVSTDRPGWASTSSPAYGMPTFYPSATVDTATEVSVLAGQEVTNIDIRYRDAQGYTVSGQIDGALPSAKSTRSFSNDFTVDLAHAATGFVYAYTIAKDSEGKSFAIESVTDGEYVLIARRYGDEESDGAISKRIRVNVKGADVIGLQVPVVPFSSIKGRVIIEAMQADKKAKCENRKRGAIEEIIIHSRPYQANASKDSTAFPIGVSQAVTDKAGEFKLARLESGRFHITPLLLNEEDLYVRAITIGQRAQSRPGVDVAKSGLSIKPGEQLTDLTIAIAEGAASLSGRVTAEGDAAVNEGLRVHLVPVETSLREDVLRYAEAKAESDGSFAIKNIAPGRYWIIARPNADMDESVETPAGEDGATRASLRREAEAANIVVELQSCQRVVDYRLRYAPQPVRPTQKNKK